MFSAYLAALIVAVIGVNTLPTKLGLSRSVSAAIVSVPLLVVFLFHVLPIIQESRRRARLKSIKGVGKAGYFRLTPREDEKSFKRADRKHHEILTWVDTAPYRLLYLAGTSGAGKSSLLTAWVIPKLERRGTKVIRLRGFQDPAAALEKALLGIDQRVPPPDGGGADLSGLLETVLRSISPTRLVVIFDQFEEFLILQDDADKARFLQFLSEEAEKEHGDVTILLVFRAEYDGFIQDLKLPTQIPGQNLQKVSVFTEVVARDFLLGSGLVFDERLQERVLREAAEVEGTLGLIRPVTVNLCGLVLSRFAHGLPAQFRPGHMIRGFVREAIFQPGIAEVTPKILPRLISPHVTKLPRSIDDLSKECKLKPEQVQGVMFRLGDPEHTIVRPLDPDFKVWEISHDFMVPLIDSILAQWRISTWRALRPWIPAAAALGLIVLVFFVPSLIPDPITDLSRHGWMIQPVSSGLSYNLECPSCSDAEIARSVRDLKRIPATYSVTLDSISSFDAFHMKGWGQLTNLTALTIANSPKLLDISEVSGMLYLDTLNINGCSAIAPSPLRRLPRSVTVLSLFAVPVADGDIQNLPPNLLIVDLRRTGITDAGVKYLPRSIKWLRLDDTSITDAGIKDLPRGLTFLSLDDTRISSEGLKSLPPLLQVLNLSGTRITDDGMAFLPSSLNALDISVTNITDRGLKMLRPKLSSISVVDTKITDVGIKALPAHIQVARFRPAPATGVMAIAH